MPEEITLTEQINCVKRELSKRHGFYPRWVDMGKMTQKKADFEISAMQAVLRTLEGLPKPMEQMKLLEAPMNGQWR